MTRAESQRRRQSMRFVAGQGAKTEPGPSETQADNEPEPEPEEEPPCQELDPLNTYQEQPLSMRQWMRWQNCKTYQVTNTAETYPSIKPTIDRCSPEKTLNHIDDSMEANQCGRIFQMGRDDVLAVWNQSPRKDTLAWYGIGGGQSKAYTAAVAKSLKAASPKAKKPVKTAWDPPAMLKVKVEEPLGAYVLDRDCLKAKVDKMPNVVRHLKATNALSWLHCPAPADPYNPFDTPPAAFPKFSFDEEKVKPPKHGLRRKHWYCAPQGDTSPGGVENKCLVHEKALLGTAIRRPADDKICHEEAVPEPEPRNYDELYKSLTSCFVRSYASDICEAYEQCCREPKDPPTQGCNEFTPEGAGGGGKLGDHDADKDVGKGKKGDGDDGDGDGDGDGKGGGKGDGKGGKGGGKGGKGGKGAGKDGQGDGEDGQGDGQGDGKRDGRGSDQSGRGGGPRHSSRLSNDETVGKKKPLEPPEFVKDDDEFGSSSERRDSEGARDGSTNAGGAGGDSAGNTKKEKGKKRKKRKRGDKDKYKRKGKGSDNDKDKDCPCEICCQVGKEEDSPLIKEMRQRDKQRELRDYLHQMRHRQYMECKVSPDHRVPQHKCDDIGCATWCTPRMQGHLERVQAIHQLQKVLKKRKNRCDFKCISQDLDRLLSTLCNRLSSSSSWR